MKRVLIFTLLAAALLLTLDFFNLKAAQAQTPPRKKLLAQSQKMTIPMHGSNANTERLSGEPSPNTRINKSAPSPELKKALNTPVKQNKTAASSTKLQKNQYSLDKDGKVTVFSTKVFSDLKLSEHCFKNSKSLKPNCEAWDASHKKINQNDIKLKTPEMNNKAAIYCDLIGGQNVIVKTYQHSESDFCLFKDGSLVSSWSAYDNRKLNQ